MKSLIPDTFYLLGVYLLLHAALFYSIFRQLVGVLFA